MSRTFPLLVSLLTLAGAARAPARDDAELLAQMMMNRHSKRVCSGVFLSGRSVEDVLLEDHDTDPATLDVEVNRVAGVVTVRGLDAVGRAAYRPGLGCTIAYRLTPQQLQDQPTGNPLPGALDPEEAWPLGSRVEIATPPGVDRKRLEAALDDAFAEPDPSKRRGTRAALVVFDGEVVAERYAPGFGPDRPLIIWSMTKSLTSALVGILVAEKELDPYAPAPVPEWETPGDPRSGITLDQLLRMSSGLQFQEVYEPGLIDVVIMLFGEPDAAHYAASRPLEVEPDTRWQYSSGTTNIIARLVRASFPTLAEYVAFPRRRLFDPLGMSHTVMELDESGTFVGSSFAYSTPRDLARFGLLYLQDGVFEGERLLPPGWVEYSTTPTPEAPRGEYGAQFWLNAGEADDPAKRRWPSVPRDAYGLSGFEGQSVVVVPSRRTVIVRLGRTVGEGAFDHDGFLAGVLAALPDGG